MFLGSGRVGFEQNILYTHTHEILKQCILKLRVFNHAYGSLDGEP